MKRKFAVFTIVQNEPVFLPVWAEHYARQVAADDVYILNHDSTGDGADVLEKLGQDSRIQQVRVHRMASFDHTWLSRTVGLFQQFLLQSYEYVLFTEVDEIVALAPGASAASLAAYVAGLDVDFVRCNGYEIVHCPDREAPLDFDQRPLLRQRSWWYWSEAYSKPLLARKPVAWYRGFHKAANVPHQLELIDRQLLLLHLHKIDLDMSLERHRSAAARPWNPADRAGGIGWQNRLTDREGVLNWFASSVDDQKPVTLSKIPDQVKEFV